MTGKTKNESENHTAPSLAEGVSVIKGKLAALPLLPGVYRMLDAKGNVLYVGKAKSLRKRVTAYTKPEKLPVRIQMMISFTRDLIAVTTRTESEAFLLENSLIKKLEPRFNILLKDDKTFPHILITQDEEWPVMQKHRGTRHRKGMYFGPFASVLAVNETLKILQKAFLLRSCSDSAFKNRSRPCLLYQIKQCSAPCVGKISPSEYHRSVRDAIAFMEGKNQEIQHRTAELMKNFSDAQEYEKAALMRDRLKALNQVQSHADLDFSPTASIDIIAVYIENDIACVQVFFIRGAFNCGNCAFFFTGTEGLKEAEVMDNFLGQFYATHEKPDEAVLNVKPATAADIAAALAIKLNFNPKTGRKRLLDIAVMNAKEALMRRKIEKSSGDKVIMELADLLGMKLPPQRIEVYDNSHIQGTNAIGAMIVVSPAGFVKSAYRRFNISSHEVTAGDDIGMMKEVLTRRLTRGLNEGALPDIIIVDGGKGQLGAAEEVFTKLQIPTGVRLMGVAKGENRNAGDETLILPAGRRVKLAKDSPLLYYIQRLRDEAHRFAIGTHRAKREKSMFANPLDEIEGIGAKRKKALLLHFGSARAVKDAALSELVKVEGISENVAKKIYTYFHS